MTTLACDFETTTRKDDCRVWAWGACSVDETLNFAHGLTIPSFLQYLDSVGNCDGFFHNLAFDYSFLCYHFLFNGWQCIIDSGEYRTKLKPKQFRVLMSGKDSRLYSLEFVTEKGTKVKFKDSLNICKGTIKGLAKDFKLPIQKGEIDYHKKRPVGYIPDYKEITYLKYDCEILARIIIELRKYGLNKLTIGSCALDDYIKNFIGEKQFSATFPKLNIVEFTKIKAAYKGGFTYCDPRHADTVHTRVWVYDVNSLYPYVMRDCALPYGKPIAFLGKYKTNEKYPLFIQRLKCSFTIKKHHIPTLQIKGDLRFPATKYLESSSDEIVTLTLTNIDLDMLLKHYDVDNVEYLDGYMFKSSTELFTNYVDSWFSEKAKAKKEDNASLLIIAKLFLNNLYGKFGQKMLLSSKHPVLDGDKIVHVEDSEVLRDGVYLPVAVFVTAYAREITQTAAQNNYDGFCYADTDSLHLLQPAVGIEINSEKIGAWDNEFIAVWAKFLAQKTYLEYGSKPGKTRIIKKVTVAGMGDRCHRFVTHRNFFIGAEYEGNLKKTTVKGGVVLVDGTFTIKRRVA